MPQYFPESDRKHLYADNNTAPYLTSFQGAEAPIKLIFLSSKLHSTLSQPSQMLTLLFLLYGPSYSWDLTQECAYTIFLIKMYIQFLWV